MISYELQDAMDHLVLFGVLPGIYYNIFHYRGIDIENSSGKDYKILVNEIEIICEEWWKNATQQQKSRILFQTMLGEYNVIREQIESMTSLMINLFKKEKGLPNVLNTYSVGYSCLSDSVKMNKMIEKLEEYKKQGYKIEKLDDLLQDFILDILGKDEYFNNLQIIIQKVHELKDLNFVSFQEWLENDNRRLEHERRIEMQQYRDDVTFNSSSGKKGLFTKKLIKNGRKAFLRSKKTVERLLGKKRIEMFINGEEIIIKGQKYDYLIQKSYSLLEHSIKPDRYHIPYSMKIMDKNGVIIVDKTCVYFEKTPVLDQISAVSMFVKNEDTEREFLKEANFLSVSEKYMSDNFLRGLKEEKNNERNQKWLETVGSRKKQVKSEFYEDNSDEVELNRITFLGEAFRTLKGENEFRTKAYSFVTDYLCNRNYIPEKAMRFLINPGIDFDELPYVKSETIYQLLSMDKKQNLESNENYQPKI